MKIRLLFCAVPALLCAQLHAQSTTGIYVNPSNNVGIGTTSPQTNLDVQGNGSDSQDLLRVTRGGGNPSRVQIGHCYIQRYDGTGAPNVLCINANGGNVGIGTTSPSYPFDLVTGAFYSAHIKGTSSFGGMLLLEASNTNAMYQIQAMGGQYPARAGNFEIQNYNTGHVPLAITNGSNVFLAQDGGNVGIGTTSPATKLAVAGDTALNGSGHAYFFINGSTGDSEELWQENGASRWALGMHVGDGTENFNLYNYTTGITELSVGRTSGYVGIGTASPGYMLDVAGQVHASSFVSSTTTYADFVFKPGYKLPPLSAVEASIKKDGHLPGIPSEAEANAHGIDLASMQVKLLQKIEELTLHQIDEEKRIEQLEKENAELRERIAK